MPIPMIVVKYFRIAMKSDMDRLQQLLMRSISLQNLSWACACMVRRVLKLLFEFFLFHSFLDSELILLLKSEAHLVFVELAEIDFLG